MKLCVVIAEETTAAVLAAMERLEPDADLFEVRADHVRDLDLPALLRARRRPVVLTCRSRREGGLFRGEEAERRGVLARAVELGFDYVDVEARAGFDDVVEAKAGRGLVLSWHDFEGTPRDLDAIYERMAEARPDLVKIATHAASVADMGRLLDLARRRAQAGGPPLLVLAMGPLGAATRVLAGRYGAPFTFAAPEMGREVAPGQIAASVLARTYRARSIGPRTRVYGVLGCDVMRSLSPAIHNAAFAALGEDAVYVPLQAESLPAFLEALPSLELSGFSITRPYKQEILPSLHEVAPAAGRAGSVNTVTVRDGRLVGTSTDGDGILGPLRRRTPVEGRVVVIVGAGGAARAAAIALREAGARVVLASRRPEQAAEAAAASGARAIPLGDVATTPWDVLLNATPVGSGAVPGALPLPADGLRPGSIVFDMVYEPRETPLLAAARARGCTVIEGVEMLVGQAVGQLEAWLGRAPSIERLTGAALDALREARR